MLLIECALVLLAAIVAFAFPDDAASSARRARTRSRSEPLIARCFRRCERPPLDAGRCPRARGSG